MPTIPPPPPVDARAFLASTRLFGGLDEAALDEVLSHLEWLLVPGGQTVCRQGEQGDCLYLVFSGRLAVVRESESGEDVLLGEVGRGDSVGEIAVLTGNRRSATVRALRDVVLARLPQAAADTLLLKHPGAIRAITRILAGRLAPSERPERSRSCLALAVVPVGGPATEFVDRLAESLSALGATLRVSAQGIDGSFGTGTSCCPDGSIEHGRLTAWLNEQEGRHGFLVYEADAASSAWTRRCLRQSDRILVVAPAEAEPSLGPLGPELARLEEDQGKQLEELVLLHREPGRRPRDAARWLELWPFLRHHHLRLFDPAGFGRLARFLDGSAVGLVLGGGGARGFAHIGVIRALEEAGIPIDRVGGASMGAMIAAQYARGNGWEAILDLNRRGWVRMQPHKVYTLPVISILSKVKADRMLEMMYGDDRIEDLWLDYFCVSTNLTRTEVVVHRRGSLRRAISASITIPGVTPPMLGPNGDLLVDGGVLNNLPVDIMRRLGEGPIIASDVSAAVDLRAHPSYTDPPSPWQFLSGRFRRSAEPRPFPNILRLIHRAALLASDVYAKQAKREVELYLDLPMDGFDMFAMEALDEIVEFGYRFTREALEKASWKPESARRALAL
ncbi:MAG TPA: cyclic nucleotide-binding and patatin-like phospholipase domain-containing protein [Thermoanaerobaculia bacterium]